MKFFTSSFAFDSVRNNSENIVNCCVCLHNIRAPQIHVIKCGSPVAHCVCNNCNDKLTDLDITKCPLCRGYISKDVKINYTTKVIYMLYTSYITYMSFLAYIYVMKGAGDSSITNNHLFSFLVTIRTVELFDVVYNCSMQR